nr:EOG090X0GPB [Daphnia sinensis]
MSNAPLTSILPSGVDPNAFLAQHKELEFLSQIDSIPRSSGSVGKSSSNAPPSSQVYIDFQHSLEKYLRDASQVTTDDVCSWIQKQNVGEVNSAFIRALVTAVTERRGTDSKLNITVLKHRTEVLRRYVDNAADRELQLLFAVQTLVTQRQHPKGLIQGIFETFYDSNVVSEEGFESWVSADDPLEREGKAVAMKMITSFLTWLKEADAESRLHALQTGLSIKKEKEDLSFLLALMDWLEKTKQSMKSNETVSDEIVAQAHLENVAVKLFNWADTEDRHKHYNKNVVKAFYSAGMLFDVCSVFGELNEDVAQQKKYAKWRAAHLHNCLNSGEIPSEPAPKPDEQLINDSENMEYGFSSDLKPESGHSHVHDGVRPSISAPPKPDTPPSSVPTYVQETSSVLVTPEQIVQAQKHCKYASSALTYEDVPTAIDNLQKALRVLQFGQQS